MRGNGYLGLAVALCCCLPALAPASPALAIGRAKAEKQVRHCVNRERGENGVKKLRSTSALSRAARYHAKNMAALGFFDHIDPNGDGPAEPVGMFSDRMWLVGENIGAGYRTGRVACRKWMASPDHRANILNPAYKAFGAGFAEGGSFGTYYVLVFGTPIG